ncbi:hypothetical protein AB0B57_30440 [Micromonospora sp. NPDC049101]|uniref:hypothetical protein n=1 Tax=Micromonospora sp. NPDC049101 TaxID=3155032 RepID=UPI0033E65BD7
MNVANPVELLCEQIAGASPDVLQAMIKTFAQEVSPPRPTRCAARTLRRRTGFLSYLLDEALPTSPCRLPVGGQFARDQHLIGGAPEIVRVIA